jgi:hypothetical protein
VVGGQPQGVVGRGVEDGVEQPVGVLGGCDEGHGLRVRVVPALGERGDDAGRRVERHGRETVGEIKNVPDGAIGTGRSDRCWMG